jgi:hypothetical protein
MGVKRSCPLRAQNDANDPQQTCATLRRGSFCPVLALFFTAVALADAHADTTVRFFSRNAIAFGSMISISHRASPLSGRRSSNR